MKQANGTRPRTTEPKNRQKFDPGRVVATPAALDALTHDDILTSLDRHLRGDWGEVSLDDWEENELSLKKGYPILSVYHGRNGTKFWIIPEADRSVTTVLLPDDY